MTFNHEFAAGHIKKLFRVSGIHLFDSFSFNLGCRAVRVCVFTDSIKICSLNKENDSFLQSIFYKIAVLLNVFSNWIIALYMTHTGYKAPSNRLIARV